jgi:hypothetical protein
MLSGWRCLLAGVFVMAGLLVAPTPRAVAADSQRPVLAYYYGWWTESNWTQTSDLPTEQYDSNSDTVMRRQIEQARAAGITGFICAWRLNCERLLQLADEDGGFSVAMSLDPGANPELNSLDAFTTALQRVNELTSSPAYLRWNGKPLVVFWDSGILPGDSSVGAWQGLRAATDPGHNQFWLGGGIDFSYLDVFDALHFYDISWESSQGAAMASYANHLDDYNSAHGTAKPFVATVMPGYNDIAYRNGHQRDRENGAYYRANWDTAFSYDASAIVLTSWNEWHEGSQIEPSVAYGNQYLDITRDEINAYRSQPAGFADPAFFERWQRTDQAVQDGVVSRSWVWGAVRTEGVQEQTAGGTRLVQYFDKSRMEINDPNGDRGQQWFVTNGLLVREMIEGRVQIGAASYETRAPSDEVLAGDPRAVNPDVPGYAALGTHLASSGDQTGATVNQQLLHDGQLAEISPPAMVTLGNYQAATGHAIADVFWDYMHQSGPVWDGSGYVTGEVVDWLFAFGYPISEPYWVRTQVAGNDTWVLAQAFERRVLTYTPTNPPAYQVEMGNVGQHYHQWRYGWSW